MTPQIQQASDSYREGLFTANEAANSIIYHMSRLSDEWPIDVRTVFSVLASLKLEGIITDEVFMDHVHKTFQVHVKGD